MATIACMRISPQPRHQVRSRTTEVDGEGTTWHQATRDSRTTGGWRTCGQAQTIAVPREHWLS